MRVPDVKINDQNRLTSSIAVVVVSFIPEGPGEGVPDLGLVLGVVGDHGNCLSAGALAVQAGASPGGAAY